MSFEKNTIKCIDVLISGELNEANKKYPMFHSEHEGYAVIKEEFEETKFNMGLAERTFEFIWDNIKLNSSADVIKGIKAMRSEMHMLIAEAIQTAAMCDKMLNSMKNNNGEE